MSEVATVSKSVLERHRERLPSIWSTRAARALAVCAGGMAIATMIGLVALWPSGDNRSSMAPRSVGGKAISVTEHPCGGATGQRCLLLVARVDEGPDNGRKLRLELGPRELAPAVQAGEAIRVNDVSGGRDAPIEQRYSFGSVDRRTPLLLLAIAVAVLAVVLVTWRGLLALLGLALSLGLVVFFLLPAIAEGEDPIALSVVAAMAVTFVTVVLTSGLGIRTVTAIVAIALTLAVATGLVVLISDLASLDGRTSEVATALTQANSGISLDGIVIAGVILGVLGALTDTAVTQASAVMAIHRADPALSPRALYRSAADVGRDHLSATIHTLVLAYTGAALPLLVAIHASGFSATDALSGQDLAEPIAAALVGMIALLLSVPVSTGLGTWLVTHVPTEAVPPGHHHDHH